MRVVAPLAAVVGAAGLAGKGALAAQTTPSTGSDPDARDLLDRAIAKMQDLQTYSFEFSVNHGEVQLIPEVFTIHELEGDVVRPDSFSAESEIEVLFVDIDLKIVTIGDDTWVTNPLVLVGSDNDMVRLGEIDFDHKYNPSYGVNPDHIALPLLGILENPVIASTGASTTGTQIDGIVTRDGLDSLGDVFKEATISGFIADSLDELQVSAWIDSEDHVVRLDVTGQIFDRESAGIVRSFTFEDFNDPITIERP